MTCSILIPSSVEEKTVRKLQRLAKQAGVGLAQQAGTSTLYRKVRTTVMRRDHVTGMMRPYETLQVDPNVVLTCQRWTVGELPRCNGFEFLGKIVHTEAGNMLQLAPTYQSENIPEEWRTAKPTCDHCKTKRTRKDTFIVRDPEGVIRRVGRNCLADFLRTSPEGLIAISAFQDELRSACEANADEDCMSGGWGGRFESSTWHYLCCVFATVRLNGFVKSRPDDERAQPTYSHAGWLSLPCRDRDPQAQKDWRDSQPTAQDCIDAIGAILWLDGASATSNYIHNMKVALQLACPRRETEGLIASLPSAYAREQGRIAAQKVRQDAPDAGHFGTIGGRISVEVTVMAVITCEPGPYGSNDLVKMRTDAGHELVTFTTSKDAPSNRDVGKRFEVRGTVKKHSSYQGKAQTSLSRCVWTAADASDDDKQAACETDAA